MEVDRRGERVSFHILLYEPDSDEADRLEQYLEQSCTYDVDTDRLDSFEAIFDAVDARETHLLLFTLPPRVEEAQAILECFEDLPATLPVIALTEGHGTALECEALEQGVETLLDRSDLDPETLANTIERALARSDYRQEHHLTRRAVDAAEEGIVICDARQGDEPIVYCNQGFLRLTGYDEDEVLGRNCRFLQCDETSEESIEQIRLALERNQSITIELLNARRDGPRFWNELSITPIHDPSGRLTHYVGFQRNVTRRVQAELELRRRTVKLERYRAIVEKTTDTVALKNSEGKYELFNPSMEELLARPRVKIKGQADRDVCNDATASAVESYDRVVLESGGAETYEETIGHESEIRTFLTTRLPYLEDDRLRGTIGLGKEITKRKAMQDRLERQALHDPLTDLPNRTLFEDRLHQAAQRASERDHTFAVAYVDLDEFKVVNNSFGHPAGDEVLRHVAQRLKEAMRPEDTVARIGGDEFMFLLETIQEREELESIGEKLEETFAPPFQVEGSDVHLSASIGFAYPEPSWYEEEPEKLERLVRIADRAMYASKRTSTTSWQIFDVSEQGLERGHVQRENRIRQALQEDAFTAHYQPIYRLSDGHIAAAEVLARWQTSEGEFISPKQFIPVAERSTLICDLGEAIFEQACRDFSREACPWEELETFHIFVNLSPRQVEHEGAVHRLLERAEHETPDDLELHFEVTETALLNHYDRIRCIQECGHGILVDDFGKGYSSLSRFKEMPVDGLKLDMEFVQGMLESSVDAAIVEMVADLGIRLGIPVIAEGVEEEDQLEMLEQVDCSAVQGFHLASPEPFGDLLERLHRCLEGSKA